ncbi:hypothetical protein [Rhizobium sp. BK251]|uniref:hypothetical protein n=1 Tax=Rhizobium sp. BK251 TaxID=2512125 RepID=UPI00104761E9|nr:hypothetical protein [Rhizobium sp. BK251]TCL74569.1 hypothetical protein EV286_102129 [Rhizobium sp. BK251]
MSDCCANPKVGKSLEKCKEPASPKCADLEYDCAYNPTEVRLYGRPVEPEAKECFTFEDIEARKEIIEGNEDFQNNFGANKEAFWRTIQSIYGVGLANTESDKECGCSDSDSCKEDCCEDDCKGHHKSGKIRVSIERCGKTISLPITFGDRYKQKRMRSIGIIYGYAYEGHCYKLPKPKIMILPTCPRCIVHGDCGCDCGYDPALGYAVWEIDKLQRVVALDVRADDLKTLVLDENMPGNRSPLAYSQHMVTAPQRPREY